MTARSSLIAWPTREAAERAAARAIRHRHESRYVWEDAERPGVYRCGRACPERGIAIVYHQAGPSEAR